MKEVYEWQQKNFERTVIPSFNVTKLKLQKLEYKRWIRYVLCDKTITYCGLFYGFLFWFQKHCVRKFYLQ